MFERFKDWDLDAAKKGAMIGGTAWVVWTLMSTGGFGALIDKEMVRQWGPLFVFGMVALMIIDRNAGRQIQAMQDSAVAMRDLAAAVNLVARKDDAFQREQDAVLNHVAIVLDEMHSELHEHLGSSRQHGERLDREHAELMSRVGRLEMTHSNPSGSS